MGWDKNIMGEYRNIDKCGVSRSKMVSGAPNLMAKVDEWVKRKEDKAILKFPSKEGGSQVGGASPSTVSGTSSNTKDKGGAPLDFTSTTMEWQMLPAKKKKELEGECHQAWALFFFTNNIPFRAIESPSFLHAIRLTKKVQSYKPHGRRTLSLTDLDKANVEANLWKMEVMNTNLEFGFALTGDGYKSKKKVKYNNYILLTVDCPLFLGLRDVTGEPGDGETVFCEFAEVQAGLPPEVQEAIFLGITDTPSPNRKAWRLLMRKYPRQCWIGCMAHEISLLLERYYLHVLLGNVKQ